MKNKAFSHLHKSPIVQTSKFRIFGKLSDFFIDYFFIQYYSEFNKGKNMNKKISDEISLLKKIEKYFSQNQYSGNLKEKRVFSFINNNSFICLTAPHATNSTVYKHFKGSDWFTGAIVKYLGDKNKFSYIIRNKYLFKKCTIASFILKNNLSDHYFLDIHAMKDRPFDLAVGIGYCSKDDYKKELIIIEKLCKKYKLKYVINHPSYTGQPGLTGRLQRKISSANVLQLEWKKEYRDFNEYPNNVFKITLPFIRELALSLNKIKKSRLPYKITMRYTMFQKLKNKINWLKNYIS